MTELLVSTQKNFRGAIMNVFNTLKKINGHNE